MASKILAGGLDSEPNKFANRLTGEQPSMNASLWIWQQPSWPHFIWQAKELAPLLRACGQAQGRLLEMLDAVGSGQWAVGTIPIAAPGANRKDSG